MKAAVAVGMPSRTSELNFRFDAVGPGYLSYPTTDRFVEAYSAEQYRQFLSHRRHGSVARLQPLSLYVHIPFCESLCNFCACNKVVTKHHERAQTYLRYLRREVDLLVAHLGHGQAVTQLHLGGGTPTYLQNAELGELMDMLRRSFTFVPGGQHTIEVDPRAVDETRLSALAAIGFNRLSLGVQDLEPAVQSAVHRTTPVSRVRSLVDAARRCRWNAINLDLMYGLPKQSSESFQGTLAQMLDLRPDHLTLYAYAHQPERFKPQRRIAVAELPGPSTNATMRANSFDALLAAGYVHVGLGQFALPGDGLAIAKRQGRLRLGFQGYSDQSAGDVIGLGVSAMGRVGASYSQNATSLNAYYDSLDQGRLPVVRGLALSRDDLVRKAVIEALICQAHVQYESIELSYLVNFKRYFAKELDDLQAMGDRGLVSLYDAGIQVTADGCFHVQSIAMVFDRYYQDDLACEKFSRVI